ncbi:MAG: transcription-repair coupling factor [Chloroflexi bacterium]|nr:transcription-repair coupling factor [Chloroflexota bacterium]
MAQTLSPIITHLSSHPDMMTITAVDAFATPRHLAGVRKAVIAPIVAALAQRHTTPLLVVVAHTDEAVRLCEDLHHWLPGYPVYHFVANDTIPYEPMSPSVESTAARLRALHAVTARERCIVVAPIRAVLQPTIAVDDMRQASIQIVLGQRHDPIQLMHHWVSLGYRATTSVNEPGEINRRGGILDIFPLGTTHPLRIEFFGDEIDSMRWFEPLTQRSIQSITEITIGPANEYRHQQTDAVVHWLKQQDYSMLRSEAQHEWQQFIDRLSNDERFDGREFLMPFYAQHQQPSGLTTTLAADIPLLISEPVLVAQAASEYSIQHEQRRIQHVESGELPPWYPIVVLDWRIALQHPRVMHMATADLPFRELLADPQIVTLNPDLFRGVDLYGGRLKDLVNDIQKRLLNQHHVWLVTPQAARLHEMIEESGADMHNVRVIHGVIDSGWSSPALNLTIYSDAEIFGWTQRRTTARPKKADRIDQASQERAAFLRGLQVGDYVVHIEHGIAVYEGMIRRTIDTIEREYLNLRYAAGDKLYVPVDQVDRVSRYIGAGDAEPTLTRLGTQEWERAKRKARKSVEDLTEELLTIYAKRSTSKGFAYASDNPWQREFEAAFPYTETPDQLKAIYDVKHDMESEQPMDRLVCGDVGFGKTEVALRAAFKAIQSGKQVAILVPTTVLAQQHYETFSRRMAAFPIKVELISRFRSAKEQSNVLAHTATGQVDILIGTHRLLSNDVQFKDLGLLIVDEEQRFGVKHKERLKQLKSGIDVLTLTATPIPRTLHMSLAGIRDLSVIETPPEERMPVKTYLIQRDERHMREAIERELERDGQVYVVHNRVHSIYQLADTMKRLVPHARVGVGHGQLPEHQLERAMLDFYTGRTNVLVCTTIVENGLDVTSANTIIIDDAPYYGLAQLYQLRGRVGRSNQRAYCYLCLPPGVPLTIEAHQRLQAIQEATELGAGFKIAMRDLEIRGAGNLLGAEQSGHIAAVGFDLYSRLLEQAVRTMKHRFDAQVDTPAPADVPPQDAFSLPSPTKRIKVDEKVLVTPLVTVDLPLNAFLPVDYIPDDQVRLSTYQHMAEAQTVAAVIGLRHMLRDRFGRPPEPVEHLLTWLHIKSLALQAGIPSVVASEQEYIIKLPDGHDALRLRLQRRFMRDKHIKIGPQFVRIGRYSAGDQWLAHIIAVLETVQPTETR